MSNFEIAVLETCGAVWLFGSLLTYILAEFHMQCGPNPPGKIKRTLLVATFDKWMGLYSVDGTEFKNHRDKKAYWFPLPCIGLKMERKP